MATVDERMQKAWEVIRQMYGDAYRVASVPTELGEEEFMRLLPGFAFGEIYQRPGLELRTRSLITMGILTALGRPRQLRAHIRSARHQGVGRDQIIDVMLHTAVYAGFPAAIEGLGAAREVFEEEDAGG
ncbi:MAG: carboxymuconolactone decarboxylase family protein [Dehalococcoidia bacterium]